MSTTTATVGQAAADNGPKHRACDECRARKLACTKESDGCSRCKREGIKCHYSAQKPMGRPRKRPRDEASGEASGEGAAPAPKNTMTDVPPDTADPGLAFINLLTGGDINYLNYDAPAEQQPPPPPPQEKGYRFDLGYSGDGLLGFIGFDPAPTNIDPSLFAAPGSLEQVPSLSPASTPETPEAAAAGGGNNNGCAHTASLYLALDSMQKVDPADVEQAIRRARTATRTAYDTVFCPACSFNLDPPADEAARCDVMRNFQNLMLLAALIPSIVHAYERVLAAVDREARAATADRRRLVFKLSGFGGVLWAAGAAECVGVGELDHRVMEPAMWRLTIRALLKADVYGLSALDIDAVDPPPLHIGLKDIVVQMEQKSRARHAMLDAMAAAGAWDPPACGMPMHVPGETPTCQKVIAIAKASIDSLVIA
ncbi:hypothetical protein F4804DRAFT_331241 [Jackrogersella minutella]|nr:hypothetical protein F4804DRAFT_331241 [Jackrogersella minutella]